MKSKLLWWAAFAYSFTLVACQSFQAPLPKSETPPIVQAPTPFTVEQPEKPKTIYLGLSWENTTAPHPERAPWSSFMSELIDRQLPIYEMATDLKEFCPKYYFLDHEHQIKAIGEMWVAVAYHESGYNPKSQSVDVGTKSNRDTWSIGLFQMSVVDQPNYGIKLGYDFDDLLEAQFNFDLAQSVMINRIKKYKMLQLKIGSGAYWSTLAPGSSFVADIKKRVQSKAPGCL